MKLKEIVKKLRNKAIIIGASIVTFLEVSVHPVFADVNGGLNSAKNDVINQAKPVVNTVVVPIVDVILVGLLVFAIVKAVSSYRKAQDVELGWIILILAGIILVSTFPVWGWSLIS